MTRHTTSRRPAIALAALLGLATVVSAEVGVTDGPKGVVVNTRNGKAYAAFPDLGIVKIVNGVAGPRGSPQRGPPRQRFPRGPRPRPGSTRERPARGQLDARAGHPTMPPTTPADSRRSCRP